MESWSIVMAPIPTAPKNSGGTSKKSLHNFLKTLQKEYLNVDYGKSLLFDPAKLPIVSVGILLIELILNVFIVQRVNYTEIDWIAYMQECEGFLNGTTDYSQLKGRQKCWHNLIFLCGLLANSAVLFFDCRIIFNYFLFCRSFVLQVIRDHWCIQLDSCIFIPYFII